MSVIFFVILFFGFYIDFKIWQRISPCTVSFLGVYFILIIHLLIAEPLGFVDIDDQLYLYLLIFYLIGFIASVLAAVIFWEGKRGRQSIPLSPAGFEFSRRAEKVILLLSIILCGFASYNIYTAYISVGSFVSDDFENMLTYGVAGHIFALLMAMLPFVMDVYIKERKKIFGIIIVLIFILLFMKQVKYWVMIPLVWMPWYLICGGFIKLSLKKYITLSMMVIGLLLLLFFSVYFMKVYFSSADSSALDYGAVINDIAIHFFGYLFSGILAFSTYIKMGFYNSLVVHDGLGLFSGILNIFNVTTGSELISLNLYRPMIELNTLSGSIGNVPSLWGTILLASGYFSFILFFFIIFLLSILSGLSRNSKCLLIVYTFLTSFMFFSWFDYYYYLLTPYEVSVFCIILYLFLKAISKRKCSS